MADARSTTTPPAAIDGDTTINEAILRRPESVQVFQRFGLDACCGGGLPIAEAARRHGLDPEEVLGGIAALAALASGGA